MVFTRKRAEGEIEGNWLVAISNNFRTVNPFFKKEYLFLCN